MIGTCIMLGPMLVCLAAGKNFYNLYNGKESCAYPTKAGNWGEVNGVKFFLTNKSHAELKVYFFG